MARRPPWLDVIHVQDWRQIFLDFGILFHVPPQFLDQDSEEVHVAVLADLVQDEPVTNVAFGCHIRTSFPGCYIISISNFA